MKKTNKSKIDRVDVRAKEKKTIQNPISVAAVTTQTYTIANILMSPIELYALARLKQWAINTSECMPFEYFYAGMKQIWILKNKMANTLHHIPCTESNYENRCVWNWWADVTLLHMWKWPDHPFQFILSCCWWHNRPYCPWYRNAIFDCSCHTAIRLPICVHIESFSDHFEWIECQLIDHTMCTIFFALFVAYREMVFGFTGYSSRMDSYKTYNMVKIYSIFKLMTRTTCSPFAMASSYLGLIDFSKQRAKLAY